MDNATIWELEITSSIPASKVFHDFVLGYLEFFAKNIIPKEFMPEVVTLEGDGGIGTIKEIISGNDMFQSIRHTIMGLDLENFICTYVFNGYVPYLEEMKVIPLADGGCTFKYKKTDYNAISEDEIKTQKEDFVQNFNVFKGTVAQDSNDH